MGRKRFDMEGDIASVDNVLSRDEKLLLDHVLKEYRKLDEQGKCEMISHIKYAHFADRLNKRNGASRDAHSEMYQ
jgi:hypothetical protein